MIEDEVRAALTRHDVNEIDLTKLRHRIGAESARRRKKRGWFRAGLAAVVAAIALASAPSLVTVTGGLTPLTPGGSPINVLLIGGDKNARPGLEFEASTIMLAHVNAARTKAYFVVLALNMPVGTQFPPRSLYELGRGIPAEVSKHFGVKVDGAVYFSPSGLEKVVDRIGGVETCLKQAFGGETLNLRPGCQHIDGYTAGYLMDLEFRARPIDEPFAEDPLLEDLRRVQAEVLLRLRGWLADPASLRDLPSDGDLTVEGDLDLSSLAGELASLQSEDVVFLADRDWIGMPADQLVRALRNDKLDEFADENFFWVTPLRP